MTTTTKQFSWKDRDTAAQDLLQLAYYAPPFISRLAIQVLQAVRSPRIVPELIAIVGDTDREIWQRIYALRAITHTHGDFFVPELEEHAHRALRNRIMKVRKLPIKPSKNLYFGIDLLEEISSFVGRQPLNQTWFFAALDNADEPFVLWRFLEYILLFFQPIEYKQELIKRLLKLYEERLDYLSISTIARIYGLDDLTVDWCDSQFDTICELCLQDPNTRTVKTLAKKWDKLRETLVAKVEDFAIFDETTLQTVTSEEITPDTSPAYNFLEGTYLAALDGNKRAYSRLLKATRLWKGFIPFRAVATHFVGKLQDMYDVFPTLTLLLEYANDDWGDDLHLSPIRIEAGEALIRKPSEATWLSLVNSFFIKPRNVLADFQQDWIAYLTDVLSGVNQPYNGVVFGGIEHRSWFKALQTLPKDEAKKLIEALL